MTAAEMQALRWLWDALPTARAFRAIAAIQMVAEREHDFDELARRIHVRARSTAGGILLFDLFDVARRHDDLLVIEASMKGPTLIRGPHARRLEYREPAPDPRAEPRARLYDRSGLGRWAA